MVSVGVVGLLVSACGPTLQVRTDYDRQATFAQYQTFRIDEGQFLEKGVPSQNTIVKDRIHASLHNQLSAEGMTPAGERADLAVRYVAGARTVKELESVGYGYPMAVGPYWGPYPGDFWVNEYPEGTLVVDLIDTHRTNWSGVRTSRPKGQGCPTRSSSTRRWRKPSRTTRLVPPEREPDN